jgi:hypothetical protein
MKGDVVRQHKEPPTEVLKTHFQKYGNVDDSTVQELAKKCVLPTSGVRQNNLNIFFQEVIGQERLIAFTVNIIIG